MAMAPNGGEVCLLDYKFSPFAMRARVALREKGIPFESREQNLLNNSSLLREMNPAHKLVPVLIHNGKSICESLIIVQYIDDVWNDESPLLPTDPFDRARAKFWADYIDKVYSPWRMVWMSGGKAKEAAKKKVVKCYKVLEAELGDKSYFGEDKFGMVDVAFIPFHCYFYTLEKIGKLCMDDEFPKLVAWGRRCMERESVSATLPDPFDAYDAILARRPKL